MVTTCYAQDRLDMFDQAITNLYTSREHQEKQISELTADLESLKQNSSALEAIKDIEGTIEKLKKSFSDQFNETVSTLNELQKQSSDTDLRYSRLEASYRDLGERLIKIETKFDLEKRLELIVKSADGSAEIFNLDTIGLYRDRLPKEENCGEYGSVLEKFSLRSVNKFFVTSSDDTVLLCSLAYGNDDDWSVTQAMISDRAHVITIDQ